jgi:hypothetical protein
MGGAGRMRGMYVMCIKAFDIKALKQRDNCFFWLNHSANSKEGLTETFGVKVFQVTQCYQHYYQGHTHSN